MKTKSIVKNQMHKESRVLLKALLTLVPVVSLYLDLNTQASVMFVVSHHQHPKTPAGYELRVLPCTENVFCSWRNTMVTDNKGFPLLLSM